MKSKVCFSGKILTISVVFFSLLFILSAIPHVSDAGSVPEGLSKDAWSKITSQLETEGYNPSSISFPSDETAKLTASDGVSNDLFGYSVAISGNIIVVGARGADSQKGSVYVFSKNQGGADNWGLVKKLIASDGTASGFFGRSVFINGDIIVVGASGDQYNGGGSDSAYVFERNYGGADNWGEVRKLAASDRDYNDYFGYSVSISNDKIVIGAFGSSSGSAYIFLRNQGGADNWGEVKKLTASDSAYGDCFGYSVSISGDTIVIGAYQNDGYEYSAGAAYIFSRNQGGEDNWGQVKKLTTSEGDAGVWFGWSVSISGDTSVIGFYGDDDNGNDSGSAYVFSKNQGGADNWGQVKKLIASDGAGFDTFGRTVSIDADIILVGASGNDDNGESSGSVYVFSRNQGGADNWGEVKKLTASDGAAGDWFGYAVSISGDTIVVGALGDDSSKGSAYIFSAEDDNWEEIQKPTASDGAANDSFGYSVSISGDSVVIGAVIKESAYVFSRNQGGADNWGQVKKLVASDGAALDYFGGYSVSISGDTIVVGARGDDDNGSSSGSAYVFSRNQGGADNWGQVKKLTASDGAADDEFGMRVSISGDTIVVSARGDDDNGSQSGSAYVFSRNRGGADNWGQVKKLTASDGSAFDDFGISISISGDTVVVGANQDDDSGSAYVFSRNKGGVDNWGEVQKLTASDGAADDKFGFSISISGDTIVVGAWGDDDYKGSAYIFTIESSTIPSDYDGDGMSDYVLYDMKTATWHVRWSSDGVDHTFQHGLPGKFIPITGDFDGDGLPDYGVYDPKTKIWSVFYSSTQQDEQELPFDPLLVSPKLHPITGDFDGDGISDFGLYNSKTATWHVYYSTTEDTDSFQYGVAGIKVIPISGDFDGDGISDIGFYNQKTGIWTVLYSSTDEEHQEQPFPLLSPKLHPFTGDFDGDDISDFGLYDKKTFTWNILYSSTDEINTVIWGNKSLVPLGNAK